MGKGNGHLEWESNKNERYAEMWWKRHGFNWTLKKRFISYSEYEISKNGESMEYQIPNGSEVNMKKFLEGSSGFLKCWEQHVMLNNLQQALKVN